MPIRLPRNLTTQLSVSPKSGAFVLEYELLAEQAAALGYSEKQLQKALPQLAKIGTDAKANEQIYQHIADILYAYIIQRESLGLTCHDDIFQLHNIPKPVIARIGSVPKAE